MESVPAVGGDLRKLDESGDVAGAGLRTPPFTGSRRMTLISEIARPAVPVERSVIPCICHQLAGTV